MREETEIAQFQSRQMQKDCEQLKEALVRQGQDIDRLIEEKRDLEDLVE